MARNNKQTSAGSGEWRQESGEWRMAQPIQLSFGVGFMNIIFTLDLLGQRQRQVGKRMQTKQCNAIAKEMGKREEGRGGREEGVKRS